MYMVAVSIQYSLYHSVGMKIFKQIFQYSRTESFIFTSPRTHTHAHTHWPFIINRNLRCEHNAERFTREKIEWNRNAFILMNTLFFFCAHHFSVHFPLVFPQYIFSFCFYPALITALIFDASYSLFKIYYSFINVGNAFLLVCFFSLSFYPSI